MLALLLFGNFYNATLLFCTIIFCNSVILYYSMNFHDSVIPYFNRVYAFLYFTVAHLLLNCFFRRNMKNNIVRLTKNDLTHTHSP